LLTRIAFTFVLLLSGFATPLFAQDGESKVTPDTVRIDGKIEPPEAPESPDAFSQAEKEFLRSAYNGNLEKVGVLVSKGVDVDLRDQKKRTALILAAHNGHRPVVEFLVENGADVNAEDGDSQTALMYASKRSFNDTAALLLDKGANVNTQSKKRGISALMLAAVADNEELVRMLLEHGADASLTDIFGRTARDLAKRKGNVEMAELLSNPLSQEGG
jgi:ankyrin repeat protein